MTDRIHQAIERNHREAQAEITQKPSNIKANFSKGEFTSYGDGMLDDSLLSEFGVYAKRQNGSAIPERELQEIRESLSTVFATLGDLSGPLRAHGIKISHAGDKKMYARTAVGIFRPSFKAIGVSRASLDGIDRILAHELAHFMDWAWGKSADRAWITDDSSSDGKDLASRFRRSMAKRQTSKYRNRAKECLARAVEQYFVHANDQPLNDRSGTYVESERFDKEIAPLVELFLRGFFETCSPAPA